MSDIVYRLRCWKRKGIKYALDLYSREAREAADEIERLREIVNTTTADNRRLRQKVNRKNIVIEGKKKKMADLVKENDEITARLEMLEDAVLDYENEVKVLRQHLADADGHFAG